MTTSAMKNGVRGGSASENSTLRDFPANGMPSWGLILWLLGFKGAVQLQIAMENGPFVGSAPIGAALGSLRRYGPRDANSYRH